MLTLAWGGARAHGKCDPLLRAARQGIQPDAQLHAPLPRRSAMHKPPQDCCCGIERGRESERGRSVPCSSGGVGSAFGRPVCSGRAPCRWEPPMLARPPAAALAPVSSCSEAPELLADARRRLPAFRLHLRLTRDRNTPPTCARPP
eukprot:3904884-Prymnesium_polylepis.2